MSRSLSRRTLLKLGGLITTAAAVTTLGKIAQTSSTSIGNGVNAYGVVLTNASVQQLRDCVKLGGYNTVKVVTAWGLTEGWNFDTRRQICQMTRNTIVLTEVGNGVEKDAFPYARKVIEQIQPWYDIKPNILIEIGNEPNGNVWGRNGRTDDFIKAWRGYFQQAVKACRTHFPKAKLISSGMASVGFSSDDYRRWFTIAGDVMKKCDYIGFHAYTNTDWYHQDVGFTVILSAMKEYFSDKLWALTEYAIEDAKTNPSDKGQRYAEFIHFGKSNPQLPKNVWGATYFHLDHNPTSSLRNFQIYPQGDDAYKASLKSIKNKK